MTKHGRVSTRANGLGGGSGRVILVMDMYEHSYQVDFGAAAAQYVDAFFNNINWASVLARIQAL